MRVAGKFLESLGRRHSVIVGMTRSGKTYFTKHVLKNLQAEGYHTVFFDPKHDDDYADLGVICTTPIDFYAKLLKKTPHIVYRPSPKKDERADELSRIIEMMFALSKKPGFKRMRRIVAIDEIQLMVKKGTNDGVEMLWTIGAGMGIVGVAITQRVQLLNETCWSQSENKILFKTDDRPDYLRSRNLEHYSEKRISSWTPIIDTTIMQPQGMVDGKPMNPFPTASPVRPIDPRASNLVRTKVSQ